MQDGPGILGRSGLNYGDPTHSDFLDVFFYIYHFNICQDMKLANPTAVHIYDQAPLTLSFLRH